MIKDTLRIKDVLTSYLGNGDFPLDPCNVLNGKEMLKKSASRLFNRHYLIHIFLLTIDREVCEHIFPQRKNTIL